MYDSVTDEFSLNVDLRTCLGSELLLNDIYFKGDELFVAAGHGVFRVKNGTAEEIIVGEPANSIVAVGNNLYFRMQAGNQTLMIKCK